MAEEYRSIPDQLREAEAALGPYAEAIGRLCMAWATLEMFTSEFALALIGDIDDDKARAMMRCTPFSNQLSMIKVGVVACHDPALADIAVTSVDYIDNVLRLRRNRYVHDQWDWSYKSGVARIDPTPKTFKLPSSGERSWRRLGIAHEPVEAITDTTEAVHEETGVIADLTSIIVWKEAERLEELRALLPPRLLKAPQPGTPYQSDTDW